MWGGRYVGGNDDADWDDDGYEDDDHDDHDDDHHHHHDGVGGSGQWQHGIWALQAIKLKPFERRLLKGI